MSQVTEIKKKITLTALILVLAVVMSFMSGCGSSTPNSSSVFDSDTGSHVAGWLPRGHSVAATSDVTVCTECHGSDLSGGVAGVSCTLCHLGGPEAIHPAAWSQNTGTYHAPYAAANGTAACSNMYCHGTDLTGVTDSGPSCSSCHLGGSQSVHPQVWSQNTGTYHAPYAVANGTAACANANCHGASLTGVAGSGPSCSSCHLGGPTSVHPVDWTTDTILTKHGPYELANGAYSCQNVNCHGAYLQGVAGSGPSCRSCHSFP